MQPARLQEADDDAVVDDLDLHDVRGGRECGLGLFSITGLYREQTVFGQILPYQWRARRVGHGDIGHGGQRFVLHDDGLRRIAGERLARCHDQRDRLADMACLADRKGLPRWNPHSVVVAWVPAAKRVAWIENRLDAGGDQVAAGEHGHRPEAQRGRRIDCEDPRMRVRRAHEHRVQRAGCRDIVRELTPPD